MNDAKHHRVAVFVRREGDENKARRPLFSATGICKICILPEIYHFALRYFSNGT